ARIVKLNIANLHILNPAGDYDCRVSVNLEADLNAPHLAPHAELSEDWPPGSRVSPDRIKDRMSYRHLLYRIDLTAVTTPTPGGGDGAVGPAKFELELEVEGKGLREQMRRIGGGGGDKGEDAFADVVAGFWDNATLLMRQRAGSQ
ncbi:hypothetical protein LTR53_018657, partial [Teratosphaeriaceae sp. CCFEE 6253]